MDGWSRRDWTGFADRILGAVRPYASPGHARITPPGRPGGYGRAVDGLEGFARTFLLAGFRIAGERGAGLDELADWYATGIATGTDAASPERWVRLDEHGQAKVEAASIALILDLTRPWIWDRLDPGVQERVVEYLSPAVGDSTYPHTNWLWFRLVVQTFLRSVGGPWSAREMAEDLAEHDSFRRSGGWLSDGPTRAYDHYGGWALHLYPALWARMSGAADLAAARRDADVRALDAFLRDAVTLVGADGSPLIQGRSLTYRFAAAAPFWVGALAGVPSVAPGQLRHAAARVVGHFIRHGAPDDRGLLTVGWHASWPRLAQSYSGPASPYWASKGLLGIALPADHPVWTAPPEPLPVETGDVLRAVAAPGWLIAGTRADGIVRVVNHGTDHADEGRTLADSPLYARLGYSTATSPLLDDGGWAAPVDQSVVLVDDAGATTHRTGMRTLTVRVDGAPDDVASAPDDVASAPDDGLLGEGGGLPEKGGSDAALGVAGSTTMAHWVTIEPGQRDYGEGRAGRCRPAARLTVFSLVRGAHEVRLVRVGEPAGGLDPATVRLRVGGWPVTGGLTSRVVSLIGEGTEGTTVHEDGGPLGAPVRVPWLDYPVRPATWVAALVELSGVDGPSRSGACRATLDGAGEWLDVRVEWPDGVRTRTRLDVRDG
ncbi:DUF2264 domain-containing protein [Rugosimonospora acidiphila]|uniref:DUF2264 domain-containing protein n=1 Tax=Rugosimonospora acidiphila TaxID=556531 RepID=A0ABP9RVN1_9ACTN